MNKAFQYPFNGQWLPNLNPFHVGARNYTTLQNMRYEDIGLKTIEGYSKITTTALGSGAYTILSGFNYNENDNSFVITKVYTGSAYRLYENTKDIPNTGDYNSTNPLNSTTYGSIVLGSGIGSYSEGPSGIMLYGDSTGAYVYSGGAFGEGGGGIDPVKVLISTDTTVPLSDTFDYTEEAANITGSFTLTSSQYLYIGSPYKVSWFYITVSSANVSTSSMSLTIWEGSSWQSESITDTTASGGITLAQSGEVLVDSPGNPAAFYLNGDVLYWYRLKISAGSASISNIKLKCSFQRVTDFWNGSGRTCIGFHVSRSGKYEDYTHQVASRSTKDAPFAATIGDLGSSDAIYLIFEEPIMGIDIRMLDGFCNKISTEISSISYWDGDSYTALSGIIDSTQKSSGDTTLNKSGVITWNYTGLEQPKEEFGVIGYSYKIVLNGDLTDKQSSIDFYNGTVTFAAAGNTMTENDPSSLWPDIGSQFEVGDVIHISDTDYNNGNYTISSVSTHIITVTDGITDEASGDTVRFEKYSGDYDHDGTSIDLLLGITSPLSMEGYNSVGFYSGRAMLIDGNRVDYSLPNVPWVYNGVNTSDNKKSSLYFGDKTTITKTHSLYNRYGSTIIEIWVVTKNNETYVLAGSQPYQDFGDPFIIKTVSKNIGCPAPMTMVSVEIGFEVAQDAKRNALVWLDSNGPVLFDGAVISPIIGIENYFDPTRAEYIKKSLIGLATAYYDRTNSEYNLIFPSGTSATANNLWVVYDLKKRRWYKKNPAAYPVYTIGTKDTNGTTYNYGHLQSGHLMRLDNTQTWDGSAISQTIQTGEFSPPFTDEFGLWASSEINNIKLISEAISEDADVTVADYVNGSISSVTQTIALDSGSNLSKNIASTNKFGVQGFTHSIKFSTSTSTDKWEPLAWGYKATMIRED